MYYNPVGAMVSVIVCIKVETMQIRIYYKVSKLVLFKLNHADTHVMYNLNHFGLQLPCVMTYSALDIGAALCHFGRANFET